MDDVAPTVRTATRADLPEMARVLAAAFADDPVLGFLIPPGVRRRRERLRSFFALELPRSAGLGGAWTAMAGGAAAIWYPPGGWRASNWTTFRQGPATMRIFGRRLGLAARVLLMLQNHHPTAPHWYLFYLGAAPAQQSLGRGSALLRAVLDRCDEQGLPAYLEATNERNRALYLRHGFVERDELPLPDGGPPLYPMWREPG
ncbi:MAG: GNAT family N-acetyltransferase [Jatrophihabitantaceae bacterium]